MSSQMERNEFEASEMSGEVVGAASGDKGIFIRKSAQLVSPAPAPTFTNGDWEDGSSSPELKLDNQSILKEEIRSLQQRIISVQEEERRRIARELHDEAGQLFVTAVLKLDLFMMKSPVTDPIANTALMDLRDVLMTCANRVRNLSLDLHPPMLEDLGLVPTIEWYLRQFRSKVALEVDFKVKGVEQKLSMQMRIAVFRVIQEALTNVIKHASAKFVKVRLHLSNTWISLIVRDDGQGFVSGYAESSMPSSPSLGILGMSERVALLKGKLLVLSRPGRGTLVYARIPTGQA